MTKQKILIADDEKDIQELLGFNLEREGYEVLTASNGKQAVDMANEHRPDLILMDVMMPVMDGIEACRQIRQNTSLDGVMIAFLTARNEDYSQISGFDAGGDDYISKPIKPKILIPRLKALLRRQSANGDLPEEINESELIIDHDRHLVIYKGEEIHFAKKLFKLLSLLNSQPGKVFQRDEILSNVWGDDVVVVDRTVDVHIRWLREKLGEKTIRTVKGVGYKLEL